MRRIHELLDGWARETPDRTAMVDHDGKRFSFSELDAAVAEAASALSARGVAGGDRVMLVAENCVAGAAMILAGSRLDAWVVPINARATEHEVRKIADHCLPRAMVFTSAASDPARSHAESFGSDDDEDMGFGEFRMTGPSECLSEPVERASGDQVGALLYTTGTTGDPKGVMLTHENLLHAAKGSQDIRGLNGDDQVYCVLPMTHVFGFASMFLASLRAGALMRFAPRFEPARVLAALRDGVTVFQGVPQMHAAILDHCRQQGMKRLDAPTLRYMSSGGAQLDPDWKRRAEAFFGTPLQNGYGLTETAAGVVATVHGDHRSDASVGFPMPGVAVKLVPPPGRDDLDDGVGEIVVWGGNVMKGYYKNEDATRDAFTEDGGYRTGDLGRYGSDGALFVVGRSKELIIRSGFNVYPPEVEAALNANPAVVQAYVVGRRQTDGNEEVLAFVERAPGASATEADLKQSLTGVLAPYKRPSRIVIADRLPAAATGKILKHKLIETFLAELDGDGTA